jgi:hypothetical protein
MPGVKPCVPILQRQHPHARGLMALHAVAESGGALQSIVGPAMSLLGTADRVAGSYGTALRCDATGEGAGATLPAALKVAWPVTIACCVRYLGATSGNVGVYGATYNNADGSPYSAWSIYSGNAGLAISWNQAGNYYSSVSAITAATIAGQNSVLVGVLTAATRTLYLNGIPIASVAADAASPNYSATSQLFAGNYTGISRNSNLLFSAGATWNRSLSATEVAALSTDWLSGRFGLFTPPQRTLFLPPATGTTYASAAAGNWNVGTNWSPNGVPASGDRVTITHAITVSDDRTIGHSPGAGDANAAISIGSGGSLTINSGATLAVRGDLKFTSGSGKTLTVNGTLEFDASAAASPSTAEYVLGLNYLSNLTVNGGTVRSNASGANAKVTATGSSAVIELTDATFSRIGSSTSSAFVVAVSDSSSCRFLATRTMFDATCGQLQITGVHAAGRAELTDCVFAQTTGTYNVGHSNNFSTGFVLGSAVAAPTTGTRSMVRCRFALQAMFVTHAGWTIDYPVFREGLLVAGSGQWSGVSKGFFRALSATVSVGGSVANSYIFTDTATDNWHAVTLGATSFTADTSFDGLVFDPFTLTNTTDTGECVILQNPATLRTATIKRCLAIPSEYNTTGQSRKACAGSVAFCGTAGASQSTNLRQVVEHNTAYIDRVAGALAAFGESGTPTAGTVLSFKSNLAWADPAGTVLLAKDVSSSGVVDPIVSGAATHNGKWNESGTGYSYTAGGTAPGANDVSGDPRLVDPTRNIKTWAQAQGYAGATPGALATAAVDAIWLDPTLIDSLLAHVRGGYAPRALALKAAHDSDVSGWIGSVEGTTQGIYPTGVASPAAVGSPTVAAGASLVSPAGLASAAAVGAPTITVGAVLVSPAGIASAAAIGSPTVAVGAPGASSLFPVGVASVAAVGSPTVLVATVFVSPAGIGSVAAVGSPTVTVAAPGVVAIFPAGIASPAAVGSPTVLAGTVAIVAASVDSVAAVGSPSVLALSPVSSTILATSVGSAAAIGSPVVYAGASFVLEEAIFAALRESADLAAIVGTRIHGDERPETSAFPCLVVSVPQGSDLEDLDGHAGVAEASVELEAQSSDRRDCRRIADLLVGTASRTGVAYTLEGTRRGLRVLAVNVEDEVSDEEPFVRGGSRRVKITTVGLTVRYCRT